MPAAVLSARRPAARDDIHPGTAVKIFPCDAAFKNETVQFSRFLNSTGFLIQSILMQVSCLHDQRQVLSLIAKQRKIFQGIAVDHDDVGKGA